MLTSCVSAVNAGPQRWESTGELAWAHTSRGHRCACSPLAALRDHGEPGAAGSTHEAGDDLIAIPGRARGYGTRTCNHDQSDRRPKLPHLALDNSGAGNPSGLTLRKVWVMKRGIAPVWRSAAKPYPFHSSFLRQQRGLASTVLRGGADIREADDRAVNRETDHLAEANNEEIRPIAGSNRRKMTPVIKHMAVVLAVFALAGCGSNDQPRRAGGSASATGAVSSGSADAKGSSLPTPDTWIPALMNVSYDGHTQTFDSGADCKENTSDRVFTASWIDQNPGATSPLSCLGFWLLRPVGRRSGRSRPNSLLEISGSTRTPWAMRRCPKAATHMSSQAMLGVPPQTNSSRLKSGLCARSRSGLRANAPAPQPI